MTVSGNPHVGKRWPQLGEISVFLQFRGKQVHLFQYFIQFVLALLIFFPRQGQKIESLIVIPRCSRFGVYFYNGNVTLVQSAVKIITLSLIFQWIVKHQSNS